MAMRRPRIKATALLTTKRKSRDVKADQVVKSINEGSTEEKNDTPQNPQTTNKKMETDGTVEVNESSDRTSTVLEVEQHELGSCANDTTVDATESNVHKVVEPIEISATLSNLNNTDVGKSEKSDSSFKCPANVEYTSVNSQNNSNAGVDDVFFTDMEESILQADMQKNENESPASPSKLQVRQRIRPVPLFQRRHSFVGTPSAIQVALEDTATMATDIKSQQLAITPDAETCEVLPVQKMQPLTHRRERHYSGSMVQSPLTSNSGTAQHHYTPHKFTPTMGLGRIRTESNCSAFSDSFMPACKQRKTDEHNNRSNSRRDYTMRIVNGNVDKSTLKMFDLIYYNPVTNPMEKRTMSTVKKESTIDENDEKRTYTDAKAEVTDDTNNAMPVPQLKLNANGELILDEKTLEIETTAEQEARKVLANSSLIFLDENTGMNGFYKRQKRTKEWPPEETIKFYRCLQTVGTDFSLMCQLFPKRTRRDLKLKFKKEERSNLALINKALLYPKLFNIEDLKLQLETEEREREEALQRWKELNQKEAKPIKKVKVNTSKAARVLKYGDDLYENENIVKRKLSRRTNMSEKQKTERAKKAKPSLPQQEHSAPIDTEVTQNYQKTQKSPPKQSALLNISAAVVSVEEILSHSSNTTTLPIVPTESAIRPIAVNTPVKIESVQTTYYAVKAEHYNQQHISLANSQISAGNVLESVDITNRLVEIEEDYINFITPSSAVDTAEYCNNVIPIDEESNVKCNIATEIECKTFVDLDDGTVNTLEEDSEDITLMDSMPATPATPATPMSVSQREIDECDIQQILIDLADGSLVLVSTLDPDNADQVVNEIYMMDKTTGELCDKPLDIPESIVQGVLSVMS